MVRNDCSDFLIHFTKGNSIEDAYQNIKNIIAQLEIYGSNKHIKDRSTCVCFSEAPLSSLRKGLLNSEFYTPYSPFGILTCKDHIFDLGGRPVIYQPNTEFEELSPKNSWRHVRYEPPQIDFTWEREWRLKTKGFQLDPSVTQIIVPDNDWALRLIDDHELEEEWQTIDYGQVMDKTLARQYEIPFPWTLVKLNGN